MNQDRNVVVYLSYSGLPQDLEPNVNKRSIEDNFKRLSRAGIKIVHYFRPFLPQNADKRKIKEILDFVNQYTDTSSIMGLKLIKTVDHNSKYPNNNGNFILYSHSGNSNIAFFHNLYKLEINDDIYVYYKGIKYHYIIIYKYNIEKTGKASVIASKTDKYITLITCNQKKKNKQTTLVGKISNITEY